jgi:iron(III) transport system ATP-binding protein
MSKPQPGNIRPKEQETVIWKGSQDDDAGAVLGRDRMSKLQLINLVKRFGDQTVVRGLSATLAEGHMLVLLGPSGCGKTTTLRLVAGLLHPDDGSILVDGKMVASAGWGLPPERRNLGMVFQSYAVWPHKTVFENVAYGLELRRVSRKDIHQRVKRALDLVHMADLGARYPSELSGGQQQRVALARAIVVEPSLLLLDEPLSNLDATLREQMRVELKTLQRQLGLTSIYVTHDQAEAMVLADHLVVMRAGVIEQEGRAEEIYLRPRSLFVASFLGVTNVVEGRVAQLDHSRGRLEAPGLGVLWAYLQEDVRRLLSTGDKACISIRPMEVRLSALPPGGDATNQFEGRVVQRVFLGELVEYTVQAGELRWRVQTHSSERFVPGESVWVSFTHESATMVIDA